MKAVCLKLAAVLLLLSLFPQHRAAAESTVRKVCVDPGHQWKGDSQTEPIAPGSKIQKAKVTSGTTGVSTKKPEYALTLEVGLKLRNKLEETGYAVTMTRTENEVEISNMERAQVCNEHSEIAIRLHADGAESRSVRGFSVLHPANGEHTGSIYAGSKQLAALLDEKMREETSASSRGLSERADLTGFNWSTIPVVVLEMGFMTNPEEDRLLSEAAYQDQIVASIVKTTDAYFGLEQGEPYSAHLQLDETTSFFNEPLDSQAQGQLAPQLVEAVARKGRWVLIHTWIGDKWILP